VCACGEPGCKRSKRGTGRLRILQQGFAPCLRRCDHSKWEMHSNHHLPQEGRIHERGAPLADVLEKIDAFVDLGLSEANRCVFQLRPPYVLRFTIFPWCKLRIRNPELLLLPCALGGCTTRPLYQRRPCARFRCAASVRSLASYRKDSTVAVSDADGGPYKTRFQPIYLCEAYDPSHLTRPAAPGTNRGHGTFHFPHFCTCALRGSQWSLLLHATLRRRCFLARCCTQCSCAPRGGPRLPMVSERSGPARIFGPKLPPGCHLYATVPEFGSQQALSRHSSLRSSAAATW